MVEASPTRTSGAAAAQGNSPTFIPNSMNTRTNPVPMSNYGNEFESYLISALLPYDTRLFSPIRLIATEKLCFAFTRGTYSTQTFLSYYDFCMQATMHD